MSVSRSQLNELKRDMHHTGALVRFVIDESGYVCAVFMTGAGIRKEYWESVLSAAEFMRRRIVEHHMTVVYGGTHAVGYKTRFSYGRWRS